jgi:hypothetical protein
MSLSHHFTEVPAAAIGEPHTLSRAFPILPKDYFYEIIWIFRYLV